ncbi:transcriptional regulator, MerR family [Thermincola ferriacetica]|uniref:Transcriptional regulator, MerR family n=1 Tax=Thermincola ferriacetica TaxID=281456 RepID=A0A0L6W572_9FIRM|nr:MerR family transcriptional regulator [Thermincola ferriacetica]KNZ70680.1 transcriptional regulator, MerR family [Thermincola ferriacetica]
MEKSLTLKQVATILGVEPSTVRFWEKEFAEFVKVKSYKGQHKRFTPANVEILTKIRDLLQVEQYTIKGAKRRLEMDMALDSAMGIDGNFKTTVFFMLSAIMQELQTYRETSQKLSQQLELLQLEKSEIEEKLQEEQRKGILDFIRDKIAMKKMQEKEA